MRSSEGKSIAHVMEQAEAGGLRSGLASMRELKQEAWWINLLRPKEFPIPPTKVGWALGLLPLVKFLWLPSMQLWLPSFLVSALGLGKGNCLSFYIPPRVDFRQLTSVTDQRVSWNCFRPPSILQPAVLAIQLVLIITKRRRCEVNESVKSA